MVSGARPIVTTQTFSSRDLPESRRVAALRDLFDRSVQLELHAATPRSVDMSVWLGPDLRRAEMRSALTARMARPASMLRDGEDTVCLMITSGGHLAVAQRGHESRPHIGDGVLLVYREAAQLQFVDATYLSVRVPYRLLSELVDVEAAAARRIPRQTGALALLRAYVTCLPDAFDDPALAQVSASHVHDLMALAIGATGDALEAARKRSVGAARRRLLYADLEANCEISIETLAGRHGISPRYVQMLFADMGTTFSDVVRDLKLDKAQRLLASPRSAHVTIAAIAFEAGFGDITHFNRCFKKRYGMTPSDVRNAARLRG